MTIKTQINKPICLIGLSGSGKSTIGKLLAQKLNFDFFDLDSTIENETSMSCCSYISQMGLDKFRELEVKIFLKNIHDNLIMSIGAGAIENIQIREYLKKCFTIWTNCPLNICFERIQNSYARPLISCFSDLEELYKNRKNYYKKADLEVNTNQDMEHIITSITTKLSKL